VLGAGLVELPVFGVTEVAIQGERKVAELDDPEDHVTVEDNDLLVHLGDLEGGLRHKFLPAEPLVHEEHHNTEHVVDNPDRILEEVELEFVNVPDLNGGHGFVLGPEEPQGKDVAQVPVNKIRRRAHPVLLGLSEPELEEVDDHEDEQKNAGDTEIEFTGGDGVLSVDVPGSLEADLLV